MEKRVVVYPCRGKAKGRFHWVIIKGEKRINSSQKKFPSRQKAKEAGEAQLESLEKTEEAV